MVLTNTLAIPPEHQFDQLTVLSIAPLLARTIQGGLRGRVGPIAVLLTPAAGASRLTGDAGAYYARLRTPSGR